MRKSTGHKEKLYINNGGLCVSGDKIKLLKIPKPQKCYNNNKNIKIPVELPEEVAEKQQKKPEGDKRRVFKLKVTDYKNLQVCSKQLKQIYETVEVGDFERILSTFYMSDAFKKQTRSRERDVLGAINADEIHEEFFGQYYSYLKNVISKSQS